MSKILKYLFVFLVIIFFPMTYLEKVSAMEKEKLCASSGIYIYHPKGPELSKFEDTKICSRYYSYLDENDRGVFLFGVVLYKRKISNSDFDRFRLWLINTVVSESQPQAEFSMVERAVVQSEHFDRKQIWLNDKSLPELEDAFLIDFSLRNQRDQTIAVFTMVPAKSTPRFSGTVKNENLRAELLDSKQNIDLWYESTMKLVIE